MCSSTATLLYGIWVTTASLDFAATAYSRLQPVSQAIDLILLRRRLGTLKVEKQRAGVDELPVEVWEMIKKELLPIELDRAERGAVDRFRCVGCEEEDRERAVAAGQLSEDEDSQGVSIKHEWELWGPPDCDGCWMEITHQPEGLDLNPSRKEIARLLASYGLCTPSGDVWASDEDEEERFDFDSAVPISLPFCTTKSKSPASISAETDHFHRRDGFQLPGNALSNILPAVFNTSESPNADRRFAALIKDWSLTAVDKGGSQMMPSSTPFRPVISSWQHSKDDAQEEEKEEPAPKEVKLEASEARWMLWSRVCTCYGDSL